MKIIKLAPTQAPPEKPTRRAVLHVSGFRAWMQCQVAYDGRNR